QPALIFCMGNVSVQSFFDDEEVDVKSLRGQWHDVRGISTTVAYHPLAVRRNPNLWRAFLEDSQLAASGLSKVGLCDGSRRSLRLWTAVGDLRAIMTSYRPLFQSMGRSGGLSAIA